MGILRAVVYTNSYCYKQAWIQDLLIQDQDQDFDVQDKTETQDLQDQYWKSITRIDCDKHKVMASWKSSIPVNAHS